MRCFSKFSRVVAWGSPRKPRSNFNHDFLAEWWYKLRQIPVFPVARRGRGPGGHGPWILQDRLRQEAALNLIFPGPAGPHVPGAPRKADNHQQESCIIT